MALAQKKTHVWGWPDSCRTIVPSILPKEPNVADTETNANATDPSVKTDSVNAEPNAPSTDAVQNNGDASQGDKPPTATVAQVDESHKSETADGTQGLDTPSVPAETAPAATDKTPSELAPTENAGDTAEQPTPAVELTPAAGDNAVATPASETEAPETKPVDDANKPAAEVRADSDDKASGTPEPTDATSVLDAPKADDDANKPAAEVRADSDDKASGEPEPAPAAEPIAPVPAPAESDDAHGRAVPEGVDADKPVDVNAPLDPAASTDDKATEATPAANASHDETKPDETASKPSLGDSTNGSATDDSSKAAEQVLPPTPRIPDEHPKPAEECHRIDPLTGLELPAEHQPGGVKSDDKADDKDGAKDEGVAQDRASGYSDFDASEFREDMEKVLGHVRKAIKHEAEAAKDAFRKIEEKLSHLLARLKKGN